MDKIIKLLDRRLSYVGHKLVDGTLFISVRSLKKSVRCHYCGHLSSKVHSFYSRSFQDLPMQGQKVIIVLKNRKFFCRNSDCQHKTFAESYGFLSFKGKKTKRLEYSLIRQSLHCSSVTAAKQFKTNFADVGKSTICNLLKKRRSC